MFGRPTPLTPSEKLTSALAGLTAARDAVGEATTELYNQEILLAQELADVRADLERASTVSKNLSELLGG